MSMTCDIVFEDNPMKVVYAGQRLRGTVRLNLMDKITVRSVYIRISGKVFAQWQYTQTSTVFIKETCLDERLQLAGGTFGSVIMLFMFI